MAAPGVNFFVCVVLLRCHPPPPTPLPLNAPSGRGGSRALWREGPLRPAALRAPCGERAAAKEGPVAACDISA